MERLPDETEDEAVATRRMVVDHKMQCYYCRRVWQTAKLTLDGRPKSRILRFLERVIPPWGGINLRALLPPYRRDTRWQGRL
jgi:hypothetical protein